MTDMTSGSLGKTNTDLIRAGLARRNRKQLILQGAGLVAIGFAFLMLATLVGSLVMSGYKAFTQTHITIEVFLDPEEIAVERLPRGGFEDVLQAALVARFPDVTERADQRALRGIFSNGAQFLLRDMVVADNALIGQTVRITVPVSDPYDQVNKGLIDRETDNANRRVKDNELAWFDALVADGAISNPITWGMITNAA